MPELPPGPWTTAGRAIVAADGSVVALANPHNMRVPPQGVPGSFDPKVLALLTAAPQLLAMLETLTVHYLFSEPALGSAKALIARAKGETDG